MEILKEALARLRFDDNWDGTSPSLEKEAVNDAMGTLVSIINSGNIEELKDFSRTIFEVVHQKTEREKPPSALEALAVVAWRIYEFKEPWARLETLLKDKRKRKILTMIKPFRKISFGRLLQKTGFERKDLSELLRALRDTRLIVVSRGKKDSAFCTSFAAHRFIKNGYRW